MKLSEYEIGMVSDRALAIETTRFLDGTACTEVESDEHDQFAAESRAAAIEHAITFDPLGVMSNGNESRMDTYNWLLRRVLEAPRSELATCRDDLLALIKSDAPGYVDAL